MQRRRIGLLAVTASAVALTLPGAALAAIAETEVTVGSDDTDRTPGAAAGLRGNVRQHQPLRGRLRRPDPVTGWPHRGREEMIVAELLTTTPAACPRTARAAEAARDLCCTRLWSLSGRPWCSCSVSLCSSAVGEGSIGR